MHENIFDRMQWRGIRQQMDAAEKAGQERADGERRIQEAVDRIVHGPKKKPEPDNPLLESILNPNPKPERKPGTGPADRLLRSIIGGDDDD